MSSRVVLDTSYLITLADPNRPHHDAARRYWRHFLDERMLIFLSTIVVSEFYLRQEIDPAILRNCIILPFNWSDALKAAEFNFSQFKSEATDRVALKDDVKILAQAEVAGASHLITDDEPLATYTMRLRGTAKVSFKTIKLADQFDPAYFNDGQRELGEDFGRTSEA